MTPGACSPVLVAIEGLCLSGKTTLAHRLASMTGGVVIGEYAELTDLPDFPPADNAAARRGLDRLLSTERHRCRWARGAETPVVIMDRSPLTLIAHEYGMRALGVPADPAYAIAACAAAAAAGQILTPDCLVYLWVPEPVAAARRRRRPALPEHLVHPDVRAEIDRVCRDWVAQLPTRRRLVLRASLPPPTLTRQVGRFLRRVGGPGLPPWHGLDVIEGATIVERESQWSA